MKRIFSLFVLMSMFSISCSEEEVLYDFETNLLREQLIINEFLNRNNIDVEIEDRGFIYRILRGGIGQPLKAKDTVFFNYQIYLVDSTLLDSNIPGLQNEAGFISDAEIPIRKALYPNTFASTNYDFIDFALSLSKENSVVQMFLPSYLAYGLNGRRFSNGTVPPNTPVLFQFEVVEVRR